MKKLLLTFSLAAMLLSAKAQDIIITGAMYDPQGADAPAVGEAATATYSHKGGYEYIQLMATKRIDFSLNNFCVVRSINTGASSGAETNGWAATGLARTFKFNLTSGVVEKGEFFYVGGPEKTAGGFLIDGSTYYPILDMSGSKWIRTIAYNDGSATCSPTPCTAVPNSVGDDGIGIATTGLFPNSVTTTAANPIGMAVFSGTNIDGNSVPIDVVFTGYKNPITSWASVYKDNGGGSVNGYRVPNTDRLTAGYYADGGGDGNKFAFLFQPSINAAYFLKLSGVFNIDDHTWTTPRTANYVQLVPASGTVAQRASFATLAMLEGNAVGAGASEVAVEATKLISPLPVSLTSFTAKANKIGSVDLAWTTASEQNNSHFEVNRSTDGANFNTIDKVNGNGTIATVNNYSYTDNSPAAGVNYYQLKQIDFDGKYTVSKVVSAKVGLNQSNIKVLANKTSITVNYQALANGKASFTVYSVSGAKLATVQQNVNVGANQLSIPVQLGNSLHLLKVVQGSESVSVKF